MKDLIEILIYGLVAFLIVLIGIELASEIIKFIVINSIHQN